MRWRTIPFIIGMLSAVGCSSAPAPDPDPSPEHAVTSAPTEPETAPREPVILTMSVFGAMSGGMREGIAKFNGSGCGYVVETMDYTRYIGEMPEEGDPDYSEKYRLAMEEAYSKYYDDAVSGAVDIVCSSGCETYFRRLEDNGAFADLSALAEDDTDFDFSSLNTHIIYLNTKDSGLFSMPLSYVTETVGTAKKYVGDKTRWDINDVADVLEKFPQLADAENIFTVRDGLFYRNFSGYFDPEACTAHFDCEELRGILRFCTDRFSSYGGKADRSAESLFLKVYAYSLEEYASEISAYEAVNGDSLLIGYPCAQRSAVMLTDCLAIPAAAEDERAAGAREFVRSMVSEDAQSSYGMPVNTAAYAEKERRLIESGTLDERQAQMLRGCTDSTENAYDTRYSAILSVVNDNICDYFWGMLTLDQCLKNIDEQAENELRREKEK